MKYRKGYKYQLAEDELFSTTFRRESTIITSRIELHSSGMLLVREGYAWDGPSGPVPDKSSNMRPSCGHDALYQIIRMGLLQHWNWIEADYNYAKWLSEDGTWPITVKIHLLGLKLMGGSAALPKNRKKVYKAP